MERIARVGGMDGDEVSIMTSWRKTCSIGGF